MTMMLSHLTSEDILSGESASMPFPSHDTSSVPQMTSSPSLMTSSGSLFTSSGAMMTTPPSRTLSSLVTLPNTQLRPSTMMMDQIRTSAMLTDQMQSSGMMRDQMQSSGMMTDQYLMSSRSHTHQVVLERGQVRGMVSSATPSPPCLPTGRCTSFYHQNYIIYI